MIFQFDYNRTSHSGTERGVQIQRYLHDIANPLKFCKFVV